MKVLSHWLRSYLPDLPANLAGAGHGHGVSDRDLAEALTQRGIAVEGIFDLGPEQGSLFEMDITTNRVDAMNHYGIAREAAALYRVPLAPLETALPAPRMAANGKSQVPKVSIEAPDLCGRFTVRLLRDVSIVPSSGPVAARFKLLEQKLLSNAVDATNYVMLEMGHPTHAFDAGKLQGGIILRRARKGEKLRTLDGVERSLDPEDLVVADEKKALAIAGVMGGWETMITSETKDILVEAAWFDPLSIRRSGKRHGLHTNASHRFERGADFNAPPAASALVSRLVLEAGGWIDGELVDIVVPDAAARTSSRPSIPLRFNQVRRILGPTETGGGIEPESSERVLRALGCDLTRGAEDTYAVILPSWRLDLEREIDLIEEVARVYGYNRFQNRLPPFSGSVIEPPDLRKESAVRRTLLALGWNEAVSTTFCSEAEAEMFSARPGTYLPIANPLNEQQGILRPSLTPGMLGMLANNLNRNVEDVQLFELGTVFRGDPDHVEESPALAFGAAGSVWDGPHQPAREIDFYDLKGAVEELLGAFALRSIYFDTFSPADSSIPGIIPRWLHPFRSARAVADGSTVAWFGELHPEELQRRKLRQKVYAGEVYLERLYRLPLRHPTARDLSRFQPVQRDFSFVFPDRVRWLEIEDALRNLRIAELARFRPREILRNRGGHAANHYSLLLNVTFQSLERTLREEELQSYSQSIVESLESLGGKQRA